MKYHRVLFAAATLLAGAAIVHLGGAVPEAEREAVPQTSRTCNVGSGDPARPSAALLVASAVGGALVGRRRRSTERC